jgi:hypothetical protein
MTSRAGVANEAGSVHRRGVAVFLAAHGLAGCPVTEASPGAANAVPDSLAFETAHATDDRPQDRCEGRLGRQQADDRRGGGLADRGAVRRGGLLDADDELHRPGALVLRIVVPGDGRRRRRAAHGSPDRSTAPATGEPTGAANRRSNPAQRHTRNAPAQVSRKTATIP